MIYINNLRLDLPFKFVFSDEHDADSRFLLLTLVKALTHKPIHSLKILNPNYIQTHLFDKGVRYDVKCEDQSGNRFDIEMQNTSLSQARIKRFALYSAKFVSENVYVGDEYKDLKQYFQIIFIHDVNQDDPHLIEVYQERTEEGLIEGHWIANVDGKDILLTRIYVYFLYIDILEKEKGIEAFNDLELMIYIIKNGIDEKVKKIERKVVQAMERRIELFYGDPLLSEQAFNRQVELMTERAEKEEYRQMGKREGILKGKELGLRQGQLKTLKEFIHIKYPEHDINWIDQCQDTQLYQIQQLLFQQMSYEEFYQRIQDLRS